LGSGYTKINIFEFLYLTVLSLLFAQGLVENLYDLQVPVWAMVVFLMLTIYLMSICINKGKIKSPLLLKLAFIFTIGIFLRNFVLGFNFLNTLMASRGPIIGLAIALVISHTCTNQAKLERIVSFIMYFCLFSAIIAILQYIFPGSLFCSWTRAGDLRPSGLFYYAIPFSYALCSAMPLLLANLLYKKKVARKYKFHFVILGIIFLGLLLSLVRSSILGVILSCGYVAVKMMKIKPKTILLICLSIALTVLLFFQMDVYLYGQQTERSNLSYSRTFSGRVALAYAYGILSFKRPLGIGRTSNEDITEEVYSFGSHLQGASWIKTTSVHNNFILTSVYYGLIAGFGLVFFYLFIYKELSRLEFIFRSSNQKGMWLIVGLKGVIISYMTTSFFHNNGPFLLDIIVWYYIGMVMALLKIFHHHKRALPVKFTFTQTV